MTAKLHPEMPIHQRIALIAEALAVVLNRGPLMEIGGTGNGDGQFVWVRGPGEKDMDTGIHVDEIARELEVLL